VNLNSGGLKLSTFYSLFWLLLAGLSHFSTNPKDHFFYGSLSSLPVGLLVGILYSFRVMRAYTWINDPVFLYLANLSIVYLIGWGLSVLKRKLS
jgi:hypothetical protein